MCDVVAVMYEKSMNLRRMKYDIPKDQQDQQIIQILVDDIQALALQIAVDKTKYEKR